MKYQVLLVDDEQIYLQYLQTRMAWGMQNCHICGCAHSGEEAIQMAEELHPDIIFMDICMAQMDGLEACAALLEKKHNAKVIIMTAFNEFSFAHRAIKLNVFDYLLKPFDEEELTETLKKCILEIEKERDYEHNQRETLLKSLLDSGISDEERKMLEHMISSHKYVAVLFRKQKEVSFGEREKFRNFLRGYFFTLGLESYFLGNQKNCGIIIHTMVRNETSVNAIKSQYSKILNEHPEEGFEWIAIGNVVDGIENLRNTFQNAQLVRENRVKMRGTINSYEELQKLKTDIAMLSTSDVSLLIKAFQAKEYDKVDSMIEKMFALSENQMFSFQYVIATYYSVVTEIYGYYHYCEENNLTEFQGTQANLIEEIGLCSTTAQMLEIVRNYVYEAFSDCMNVRVGNKKELLVERIEKYLQQHYMEQSLSVKQIAENLYFENSYIRRVYKMQTGKTIIQRLEEIRMDKAGELLRQETYKNSEVAEMTGYCDQYYFSKRFKLFYGCTPSEYQSGNKN